MSLTARGPDGRRPANIPEQPGDPAASRCRHLDKNTSNEEHRQQIPGGAWSPHRQQEKAEPSDKDTEHHQTPNLIKKQGKKNAAGPHQEVLDNSKPSPRA